MSASEPDTRINEASVSRYALATHCWPARPPPSSSAIRGSAMLTTVASTATTEEPRIAATSAPRFASIRWTLQTRQCELGLTGCASAAAQCRRADVGGFGGVGGHYGGASLPGCPTRATGYSVTARDAVAARSRR